MRMNAIFATIFIFCSFALCFSAPERFLETLLAGASKSAALCLSLIATYAVWMGLMRVWQDSGATRGVSRLIKPIAKRLFLTDDDETLQSISMNLSVNLLGISGAATPYGIKAANLLSKTKHADYACSMFFVINATSIQLFPSSIVAVRVAMQSGAPTDVVLPTLFTTFFSTALAMFLVWLFFAPKKHPSPVVYRGVKAQTRGAGTR